MARLTLSPCVYGAVGVEVTEESTFTFLLNVYFRLRALFIQHVRGMFRQPINQWGLKLGCAFCIM